MRNTSPDLLLVATVPSRCGHGDAVAVMPWTAGRERSPREKKPLHDGVGLRAMATWWAVGTGAVNTVTELAPDQSATFRAATRWLRRCRPIVGNLNGRQRHMIERWIFLREAAGKTAIVH